jgi:hypothetical protein
LLIRQQADRRLARLEIGRRRAERRPKDVSGNDDEDRRRRLEHVERLDAH